MNEISLIIIYLFFGVFAAVYQFKKVDEQYHSREWYNIVEFVFFVAGWPVIVLWGWFRNLQMLEENKKLDIERYKEERRIRNIVRIINRFVAKNFLDADVTDEEKKRIKESIVDIGKGYLTEFYPFVAAKNRLRLLWKQDVHPELYAEYMYINTRLSRRPRAMFGFDKRRAAKKVAEHLPWLVGMTDEFIRALRKVDAADQEGLLESIKAICRNPITVDDGTMKPLSGVAEGIWRCRMGGHSIIYLPVASSNIVILLASAFQASAAPVPVAEASRETD